MGVYIKGMEMPKHCRECFLEAEGYFCWAFEATRKDTDAWNSTQYYGDTETLPEWCPLVPVPPHGDLIDRDKMFVAFVEEGQKSKRYKIGTRWELNGEEIRHVIANLPDIIPAEPPKEEEE